MKHSSKTRWVCRWTGVAAVLFLTASAPAQNAGTAATPVPKVSGPLPLTADSHPLLAAERNLQPVDLRKFGYVEEEFIVSGTANVYDWAPDGALRVKTANGAYATRILVRHPADPARFSGNVTVELLSSVRRFDWSWLWGYAQNSFLERGDAWVGVTMPGGVAGLKKFNAARYAALSFANPAPGPCAPGGAAAADTEEGLRWDMISQVGALLKSKAAGRPLNGFPVAALFLTTGQSPDLMTYINAIHAHATIDSGKPVYDGYLIKQPAAASRINQCATAPAAGDARRAIGIVNVPIIAVSAQGEVVAGQAWRRDDGDGPSGAFRLYEIAGAAHIDGFAYAGLPSFQDQMAAGAMPQGTPDWPITARCAPDIPLSPSPILAEAFDAAFANLADWVRKGTPAPRAARIELKDAGTPQAAIATDASGNAAGGVRSPYVDVPAATYFTTSPGPGTCSELGHKTDFDASRMQTLYGSAKNYSDKVAQSVDALVQARWLTETDGRKIKAEAAK